MARADPEDGRGAQGSRQPHQDLELELNACGGQVGVECRAGAPPKLAVDVLLTAKCLYNRNRGKRLLDNVIHPSLDLLLLVAELDHRLSISSERSNHERHDHK